VVERAQSNAAGCLALVVREQQSSAGRSVGAGQVLQLFVEVLETQVEVEGIGVLEKELTGQFDLFELRGLDQLDAGIRRSCHTASEGTHIAQHVSDD